MEQRPLRLGDVVDDYCPRERRITNHAIVAIVGDEIRQTRCTTCESDHVYKQARVPRRKKKDDPAALYDQVLADAGGADVPVAQLVQPDEAEPADAEVSASQPGEPEQDETIAAAAETSEDEARADEPFPDDAEAPAEPQGHDLWLAHRRLIRAQLPRTDNDPPVARPIPEFTMHQRQYQRGGGHQFRSGNGQGWQGNGNGNANGNVPGPHRHGGGRHGRPGGGEPGGGQPGQGRKPGRHRGGRHRRPR